MNKWLDRFVIERVLGIVIEVYSQYEGYELDAAAVLQYMWFRLIDSEAFIKEFLDYTKKVQSDEEALRIREQEVSRREKSLERELEDHFKNGKLTQEKIWEIRDPNAVF